MTLSDLMARFSDDECCRELLERLRWPTGPKCIRCNGPVSRRNEILTCNPCHYEFRVTTATIFGDTHLALERQLSILINAGGNFQLGPKGRHFTLPQSLDKLIAKAEGR